MAKDPALKIVEDAIEEQVKAFRLDTFPQPGNPMTAEQLAAAQEQYEKDDRQADAYRRGMAFADWELGGGPLSRRLSRYWTFRAMNTVTYGQMLREIAALSPDLGAEFQLINRGFRDPAAEAALVMRVQALEKETKR